MNLHGLTWFYSRQNVHFKWLHLETCAYISKHISETNNGRALSALLRTPHAAATGTGLQGSALSLEHQSASLGHRWLYCQQASQDRFVSIQHARRLCFGAALTYQIPLFWSTLTEQMEVRIHNQPIAGSVYELSLTVTVVHLIGRVSYSLPLIVDISIVYISKIDVVQRFTWI